MKNNLKFIALFLVIALLLAGCKTQKESTGTGDTANSANTEETADKSEGTDTGEAADKSEGTATNDTAAVEDTASTEKTVLRFGAMSSCDVIPFVMINENGLADKYNFKFELEVFNSAKDRDAAFQAGELDGVITDYVGVCMYQNANFDVKITGITDGDYVLLAGKNSGITDINGIKGKSIAMSENTVIDYTLDSILEANGLQSNDVGKEIIPRIPDRLELLRNEKVDLGLLPEPFASIALNEGAVYLSSANDIGLYSVVSAFTKAALDEKSEAIKNLYKAYNEAVTYINNTDISEYEAIVIETVGYPAQMKGQITMETYRTSTLPPKEDVERVIKWASGKGLCSTDLTYEQMVYDVYTE